LVTTVIVPLLHDPVMLAKALATGDMLCAGRLTVGIGVGGRAEDYRAVSSDPKRQSVRGLIASVAIMKRVWAGENRSGSVVPVGPPPVQQDGSPLLIGTLGSKTTHSAAACSDGIAGVTLDLDAGKQNDLFEFACSAWEQAGQPKPHLATSFWFALGDPAEARAQIHRHLRRYMIWIPSEHVDALAATTGCAGNEDTLVAALRAFEAVGTDEAHLIPTSSDRDQLRRVAQVAADFQ
jgi:alkanesulfonate monooxygenase SsuD/methylene tetrahydromethanopterin reductase-like flavin-dependent oxidoreductase (luciferase family)